MLLFNLVLLPRERYRERQRERQRECVRKTERECEREERLAMRCVHNTGQTDSDTDGCNCGGDHCDSVAKRGRLMILVTLVAI